MAEGDFTIPTFPGFMPLGGGGCGCRRGGGLEGKDATLIAALRDGDGHRHIGDAVNHNGRDILREILESKFSCERSLHEVEVRVLEKLCDLREKVEDEGEKTRNLIRKFRDLDQAAEIAELKAKLLILTPPPAP